MAARKKGRMGSLGDKAFKKTDKEFAEREAELLLKTSIDWEQLRPKVGDPEHYDKLMAIVEEATENNEHISRLKERVESLGKEGITLARKVLDLSV